MNSIRIYSLNNVGNIKKGDELEEIIIKSLDKSGLNIDNGDILVIAHKIVSKSEGRVINLSNIKPSQKALKYSKITGKNPALIELILKESKKVLKVIKGIIIARHKLGYVCTNAGIDHSNAGDKNCVVLLPQNPDKSAKNIRIKLEKYFNKKIAVVINDTHGRSFRKGAIGIALGSNGIRPLVSYIGKRDRNGYKMKSSVEAIIDEIASAATLLMGQVNEGKPIVLIKGIRYEYSDEGAKSIIRKPRNELFN